ncbi:hypothetical protein FRB91_000664 [Serendipita sp. 411]|nr:hypothetical protein FRC16_002036 [Serendipita sp. 398]KAG8828088.1 hypothetical protein FRC19_009944 [Serendipita sp. 401]KAG8846590.1 hypothetical protein FRB91_000664 [Serendipita sp. 411]KAG8875250.1 hypothetical protein FRC20_004175 [Serendipita sp. 405]
MASDLYNNPWPERGNVANTRENNEVLNQQPLTSHPKSPSSFVDPWRSSSRTPTATRTSISTEEDEYEHIESVNLTGADVWRTNFLTRRQIYRQGGTIDWQYEEAVERVRQQNLGSQRGLRKLVSSLLEGTRVWLVLCLTGAGVGIIGAFLDILVAWLSDLKTGRCKYGFFYNEVACCSGLDASEICGEWQTWSKFLGLHSIFLEGPLQWLVYVFCGVCFASTAGILVRSYAPYAFHTGIPEIKAILGGYVFDEFLTPWTLLIKSLGLALSVASGLSLGKEGPLVHVSCCLALLLSSLFPSLKQNEAQKRYVLAAAAAAGVSVAFGSPLGAVIFGLEELDLFSHKPVIWRAFVTCAIAAVSLQYIDPFGTSKLVLFQVHSKSLWRDFELIPWSFLAVAGGVLGSFLIKLNVRVAVYRQNSLLKEWPLLEVFVVSAVTAIISYPLVFLRVQSSSLVADLFAECDPNANPFGLCDPHSTLRNVFLLLLTASVKLLLTAWTFGIQVPAGIFLPSITIGATLGRAVGLIMHSMHQRWPYLWIFNTCPPEPGSRCIYPGFYSVVGAAAMLGGVTRMTVSLVAILFELTGALSHVLPIMISVIISKFIGDALGKEGIYAVWIQLRGYPAFPNQEFRDAGQKAGSVMVPVDKLVCVGAHSTLRGLEDVVDSHSYYGFPVLNNGLLIGYVTRERLKSAIAPLLAETQNDSDSPCTFLAQSDGHRGADLSDIVDESPMHVRKEMPLELVTAMFQRMNLRSVMFTSPNGKLLGMLTKRDVIDFTNTGLGKYKGALATSRDD